MNNQADKYPKNSWIYAVIVIAIILMIGGFIFINKEQKSPDKKTPSKDEDVVEDYNLNMSNNKKFTVDDVFRYTIPESYEQFSEVDKSIVEKVYDADEKCTVRLYALNYNSYKEFSKEFKGFYQLKDSEETIMVNDIKWKLFIVNHTTSTNFYYITEYNNQLIAYIFGDYGSTNCIKDKDTILNSITLK